MKITLRDAAITSIIIIIGVLIMVAVIFAITNNRRQEEKNKQTQELMDQIKQQALDENKEQQEEEQGEQQEEIKTFNVVLNSVQDNMLTLKDEETDQIVQISLAQDTTMTYNNNPFNRVNFYQGDKLSITARKTIQNQWEAKSIVVLFSASPNTEAPIPQGLEERPNGEFKPLGNE